MFRRLGIVSVATMLALATGGGTAAAVTDPDPYTREKAQRAVLDVAHRGASAYAPENTLAAIDVAADIGATAVEIDVQRSKDGHLVVIHDTTLSRTTDVEKRFPGRAPYNVRDFTLSEIKQLDAGSWFGSEYAGAEVPTLQEALDLLAYHRRNLLLEIKSPVLYPGIESDIARTMRDNPYWLLPSGRKSANRLVIQSFDRDSVKRSKKILKHVPHGILGRVDEDDIDRYGSWADMINPNHTTINASYVRKVHAAGMHVVTYTLNERDEMRRAIRMGVDGIISDRPDVLADVIAEERSAEERETAPVLP
ncbi:glycerophosphodiester phosphodiesterase [Nocardiopsis gilva YIM 90087]|uniref:Glycerophosphodiester phosphodiesterase n=1 Tax=Nocardiopsis gilva YIM 90087 TaxID=1235441 RepID=A0A223SA38_9ACTN|nr:glycerophosphodiester phosphodiesterase family protein [Nocardiopsis gilva]ASU84995.1 glycerophosphodiester phosphodiesterase [Nocardiopsis gilva YIM 90087]